jgi:hypothetical protein
MKNFVLTLKEPKVHPLVRYYPIKADSHFFWPISLKITGNVHNGKNRIPLFLFLCKMKDNKDNRIWIFLSFLTVRGCLTFQDYQIFTVYRIEHREFKSVEIFCLPLLVFEIEAFTFFLFLTVRINSVMTYEEK